MAPRAGPRGDTARRRPLAPWPGGGGSSAPPQRLVERTEPRPRVTALEFDRHDAAFAMANRRVDERIASLEARLGGITVDIRG